MKQAFIEIGKRTLTLSFWKQLFRSTYLFISFFILLILFICEKIVSRILFLPFIGVWIRKINIPAGKTLLHYEQLVSQKLDNMRPSEVKRNYLINLAYKNLMSKKTRSFITILGMSVGIGIIVFLLSLGYGIERLVISKVASLDELKMIDVSSSENTALRLNKTVYEKISRIQNVEKAIPLVSVVGKISYNKAVTDVLVYAAPRSYLDAIKVKLLKGKLYANNQSFVVAGAQREKGSVAGASTIVEKGVFGQQQDTKRYKFNIYPLRTVPVWDSCTVESKVRGYTTRMEGGFEGVLFWGGEYAPFDEFGRGGYDSRQGIYVGKWIKGFVPLYQKNENEMVSPKIGENGRQDWIEGCIQERDTQIQPIIEVSTPRVLGESTQVSDPTASESASSALLTDAVVVSSSSSGIEMVTLQSSASAGVKKTDERLTFSSSPDKVAVVSSGLLNLLGIATNKGVGTVFSSSFIIGKSLSPTIEGKAMSEAINYTIIGIIDDPENTFFYIPYDDIRKLSVPYVSQFKIILKDATKMVQIRKEIETLGFRTNSTVDTVKQIESLFVNLRVILMVLGLVALGVAALGMFNTLTVSLLERTREIGGMKTMGMVSEEVQDLFLAEAMIMGLSGGFGGLFLGFAAGKTLSLLVSTIALTQGQGFLDLTYIPSSFSLFIVVCSFIVGVATGIYPSERAKRISALNALRYE